MAQITWSLTRKVEQNFDLRKSKMPNLLKYAFFSHLNQSIGTNKNLQMHIY